MTGLKPLNASNNGENREVKNIFFQETLYNKIK